MPNIIAKKLNIWDAMLNFDSSNKGGVFAFSIGALIGWLYNLFVLLDLKSWSWEFAIRGVEGIAFTAISALSGKIIIDFYTIKLKHKIFKNGKKHKTQTDKADEANVA